MIISLLTFIANYPRIRKESRPRLNVKAKLSEDKSEIQVHLANISYNRRITIKEVEFYYGVGKDYRQYLLRKKLDDYTMEESKTFDFSIETKDLKQAAIDHGVVQKRYHLLWIEIIASDNSRTMAEVEYPSNYFEKNPHFTAVRYMATDDLLGFSQIFLPIYPRSHRLIR